MQNKLGDYDVLMSSAFTKNMCWFLSLIRKCMLIIRNFNPSTSKFVEMHMVFTCLLEEVSVVSEMKFHDYDAPIMNTFAKIQN